MKMLIATDGSDFSTAAVAAGCDLAKRGGSNEIKVLSVYEPQQPIAMEPFAISSETYLKLDEVAKLRAENAVDKACKYIDENCGTKEISVTGAILLGKPARAIIDEADRWPADLVIVGSHGRGFWGRLTLGSVSDAVTHHAKCSVLVVKGKDP